jgi:N6-L-threonylcarbamoyladenine synthase
MRILGIESSCDDTSVAVVEDGSKVLSCVVASQGEIHAPFGGVVPELASRRHVEVIAAVCAQAIDEAGLLPKNIDAVAATQGPGLVGSLIAGFCFAKAWAFGRGLPFVGVNHLLGHVHSLFLGPNPPDFPFVALIASGGHTSLYLVSNATTIKSLGHTLDDAAGEAFDKVAKVMGLDYPGGPVIDRLATDGNPLAIDFPRSWLNRDGFDFSFSGVKTAVGRHIEISPDFSANIKDIAASFQAAVIDVLAEKTVNAAKFCKVKKVAVCGGVAANQGLRAALAQKAAQHGLSLHLPLISLCGDNAAMIAAAGFHLLAEGQTSSLDADVFSRA